VHATHNVKGSEMLNKSSYILPFVIWALLGLGQASGVRADDESLVPSITVVGNGNASAKPDQGEINVGVVTQRTAAVDAMNANSAAARKVLERLTQLGVAARDVKTTSLSLNPLYSRRDNPRDPPKIIGYEAANQVHIVVRNLDKMGNVLDAVVREGANRLNGVSFTVADATGLLDEARTKAIQDARRKAELYAKASGVELGPVLSVQEVQPHLPRPKQFRLAQAADSAAIAPGELEFRVNITVTYRIDNGEKK
jgi:uncharacterized protein YggE